MIAALLAVITASASAAFVARRVVRPLSELTTAAAKVETGDSTRPSINSVAFSPDGKSVASANCAIQLWEPATAKEKAKLLGHTDHVNCVTFSARNSRRWSSVSSYGAPEYRLRCGPSHGRKSTSGPVVGLINIARTFSVPKASQDKASVTAESMLPDEPRMALLKPIFIK